MRRFLLFTGPSVALAFVAMACIAWPSAASAHRRFPVQWDEPRISATIKPGETQQFDISLTAAYDLPQMSLSIGSKISPYVAASSSTVGPLKKGQSTVVSLTVEGPIDAGAGTQVGLVSLTLKFPKIPIQVPLPKPLTVGITVVCPCLPPDPHEAGKATLEGIDSDNDGVRDDIQRYIAVSYLNSAATRAALSQMTIAFQEQFAASQSSSEQANAFETAEHIASANNCLFFVLDHDPSKFDIRDQLESRFLNTRPRWNAAAQFNSLLQGPAFHPIPQSGKAACSFDVDSLQN